jgi:putative sterol carrier protein
MAELTLASATTSVRSAVGHDCGLGRRVKFDFGPDGLIVVDAAQIPNVVHNAEASADCTLEMSLADFCEMNEGRLNSTVAFMTGRLRIHGDMSLAMKLDSIVR